ncbi:3094_t:CDS:1, partial [Dentiscutata heterogama]
FTMFRITTKNSYKLKRFLNFTSEIQKNHHLKELALDFHSCFETLLKKYNFSNTKLNNFELDISEKPVEFKFTESNPSLNYLDSTIYAYDKGLISRESYRNLVAIQPLLEREHTIAIWQKEINKIMEEIISIKEFNIKFTSIINNYEEILINEAQIGN